MPGQLTLTVGTNTAVVPLTATNAKINAVILRYATYKQINTEGLNATQIGELVLQSLIKTVMDGSMDVQRNQLLAEQRATLEQTVATDNAL